MLPSCCCLEKLFVKCTCFFLYWAQRRFPKSLFSKSCIADFDTKTREHRAATNYTLWAWQEKGFGLQRKGELHCLSEKWNRVAKKIFPPQNAICRVCLLTARHLVSERNTSQQKSSIWKERKENKKTILSLRLVMFKCSFGLPGSLGHKLYRLRISLPQTPK